jgi:hypothetical protein
MPAQSFNRIGLVEAIISWPFALVRALTVAVVKEVQGSTLENRYGRIT